MDSTESVGSLPKAFGRYRVEKVLGEGAMGVVYLARDSKLDRQVALKVPKFDDDPEMMERFLREARSAATLLHRNICPVHDIGDIDGVHYISMAYIAGRPLSALIDRDRPQSQRSVSMIVRKLALALETAHQAGVIHRDLKPANVMLDQQNEPVIMDFGLARQLNIDQDSRLTQSGSIMGSPAYMSPEQVNGDIDRIGPPSDIYSLGVFLYEFLTGEVPFDGPPAAVFGQILTQDPQKPSTFRADLDPRLEAICLKMMARKIEDRYGSMREAATALSDFLKNKGQSPDHASVASSPIEAPSTPTASDPPPAKAPFPSVQAKAHQQAWAKHLGADVETTNSIGMKMLLIPPGEFQMGSPDSDSDADGDEKPQHLVKITKPFILSVYEITQQQYEKVMGVSPWQGKFFVQEGRDNPATWVSHDDAVEFCRKLSKQEGVEYRLPTEAEWEYACRAGTTTAYSFGDDASQLGQYAWYNKNAWDIGERYAHGVGQRPPNSWGLYDMHGNVFEWCQDWYAGYGSEKALTDPTGPAQGEGRVLRGGSFFANARLARSADRDYLNPDTRPVSAGFRVARTIAPAKRTASQTPRTEPAPPSPAIAPFKEAEAKAHQQAWAKHLGADVETTNRIGMKMLLIPPGEFTRGSPQHQVTLTKPFHLSVYEITQQQYAKVMGTRPWRGKQYVQEGPDYPATYVTWHDAVEFCRKLSKQEGVEYRLPTEAEWEYACRAGTTTAYSFGDDASQVGQYAWYDKNAWNVGEKYAHRVGQKLPNPWGLHDMHGNVWEWCQDWYAGYGIEQALTDPLGPAQGGSRVLRGGSFFNDALNARSATRAISNPGYRPYSSGFRVARTYP